MTDKTPATLDQLWDEIPTGPAPIVHLVTAGHVARRRKRRTALAGIATVTVVILGGGFLATQGLRGNNSDAADGATASAAGRTLAVHVERDVSRADAALFDDGPVADMAAWRADDQTLVYISQMAYNGCTPEASASVTEQGALTLHVRATDGDVDSVCTAQARRVTVTVDGLTEPPTELTLVALGKTSTIPVRSTSVVR